MADLHDVGSGIGQNWALNRADNSPLFPNPFFDYASTVQPQNIRDALWFGEHLFLSNPLIREAARRVISYFITSIEVTAKDRNNKLGDDEKARYDSFLEDTLDIKSLLQAVGLDFMAYGNAFLSLIVPFRRYLNCPGRNSKGQRCGRDVPLKHMLENKEAYRYQWRMPDFYATCPGCGYSGKWTRIDRRSDNEADLVVRRWPAHQMEIRYDEIRDHREYVWRIPEDYRAQVRRGDPQVLEGAPWEIIEAIQAGGFLLFGKDMIYHMREPTLSGLRHRGWGYPRALVNFKPAWLFATLNRYNEAIVNDYIVPFRSVSPAATSSSHPEAGDPLMSLDLGGLRGEFTAALRARRIDPCRWNFFSHPLEYQVLGGEANQLAPHELIEQAAATLLNAFGVPAELYKGTLSMQSMLPAIRLFQSSWTHFVHSMNGFIAWLLFRLSDAMGWEPATGKLTDPTLVDDVQNVMAKLQLAQQQQISLSSALQGLGLQYRDEVRKIMDEERFKQEEAARLREEMDMAALMDQMASPQQAGPPTANPAVQTGGPPQPGTAGATPPDQPAAGPADAAAQQMSLMQPTTPNQKITPQELQAKGEAIAADLMTRSEGERQSHMTKLKQMDPTLHMAVKQTIENLRQKARTVGGKAVLQQQFGGQ